MLSHTCEGALTQEGWCCYIFSGSVQSSENFSALLVASAGLASFPPAQTPTPKIAAPLQMPMVTPPPPQMVPSTQMAAALRWNRPQKAAHSQAPLPKAPPQFLMQSTYDYSILAKMNPERTITNFLKEMDTECNAATRLRAHLLSDLIEDLPEHKKKLSLMKHMLKSQIERMGRHLRELREEEQLMAEMENRLSKADSH